MSSTDPTTRDPEIQIEIPTRRGPEPITSGDLRGVGYSQSIDAVDTSQNSQPSQLPVPTDKNVVVSFCEWYLFPYKNILYCLKCVLYHFINFFFMLGMFILTTTYIPLNLGLIVLACTGLLLFYFSFEFSILMAWTDVAMGFYLVEDNPEMLANGRPKLGYRSLPECGDCTNRVKTVMGSAQSYKTMIYYLIFKPVVVFVTSSCLIVLICEGGLLSLWIIVVAHPEWFKYQDSSGMGIHDVGGAIGVLVGGIALLPFVLYVVIWCAKASKIVTYFFLTNVYGFKSAEEDKLLDNATNRSDITNNDFAAV